MSELIDKLRDEFQDEEYRHSYAEECLNTMIATQIKVLREQREMTQEQLADKTGMKQSRIPLLEDSNYSSWTINTLKRFAEAFDLALSVKFETFSTVILDFDNLSRESLARPSFANDALFQSKKLTAFHRLRRRRSLQSQKRALQSPRDIQRPLFQVGGEILEWPQGPELDATRKALIANEKQGERHAIGVGNAS
jgi:transcriptional regulator with XRE-family HTH domain